MSESPAIDRKALERMEEWGGPGMPRKMIDLFMTHTPERLAQLREGIARKDPEVAETGAHSLKSSAGNVGATRLQELCQKAELMAEEKDLGGLEGILSQLEAAYSAACQELDELMEGMEK